MKTVLGKTALACCTLAVAGCGGFPELLMDTARDSAKEAVQEKVDETVNLLIDQAVGTIVDEIINDLMGFDAIELPILDDGDLGDLVDDVINDGDVDVDDGNDDTGRDPPRSGGRS